MSTVLSVVWQIYYVSSGITPQYLKLICSMNQNENITRDEMQTNAIKITPVQMMHMKIKHIVLYVHMY